MWQSSACQRSNSPLPKISLGWMAVLAILLRGNSFPVILVSTKKRNPGLANHARQGTDAWEELEGQVASCKPCCIYPSCVRKNHGERMFWLLYNYFETSPNSAAYWEEKSTAAIVQEVLLPIRPPVPIALNVQKAISQHMLVLWTAIRVLQVMKV